MHSYLCLWESRVWAGPQGELPRPSLHVPHGDLIVSLYSWDEPGLLAGVQTDPPHQCTCHTMSQSHITLTHTGPSKANNMSITSTFLLIELRGLIICQCTVTGTHTQLYQEYENQGNHTQLFIGGIYPLQILWFKSTVWRFSMSSHTLVQIWNP